MNLQSPHKFIISPLNGEQYNTHKKIGDTNLIITTSIESHEDVQRLGTVLSVPFNYKGDIRKNDIVVIHHNIFRITYSDTGIRAAMQSNWFIKDNLFGVEPDLIYMVIRNGEYIAIDENCFVAPINYDDKWLGQQEKKRVGVMRYPNKKMKESGLENGDLVAFRKNCEFEFSVNGEKLYMMRSNRILAKLNAL